MRLVTRPLFLAVLLASAAPALAADYDPPMVVDEAPEYVPAELGSGWYLRGDVGVAVNNAFEDSENGSFEVDKYPIVAGVGVGYHWTDYFRTDLGFELLPGSKSSSDYETRCAGEETITRTNLISGISTENTRSDTRRCRGEDEGSNRSYGLFANAYVDLGTYVGITPYIGGGVGAVYTKTYASTGAKDCEESSSSSSAGSVQTVTDFKCYGEDYYDGSEKSDNQYNFAYNLAAGLSYRLTNNGSIDLGYQYISVPDAETVDYNKGVFSYHEGIDVHSVKLGYRFDMW